MPTIRFGSAGMSSPPRTWASSLGASLAAQPAHETISVRRIRLLPSFEIEEKPSSDPSRLPPVAVGRRDGPPDFELVRRDEDRRDFVREGGARVEDEAVGEADLRRPLRRLARGRREPPVPR